MHLHEQEISAPNSEDNPVFDPINLKTQSALLDSCYLFLQKLQLSPPLLSVRPVNDTQRKIMCLISELKSSNSTLSEVKRQTAQCSLCIRYRAKENMATCFWSLKRPLEELQFHVLESGSIVQKITNSGD